MFQSFPSRRTRWRIGQSFAGLGAIFMLVVATAQPVSALPSNLVCNFNTGTSGSFEAGTFKAGTPSPLSFSIDAINLDNQVAELRTNEKKPPGTLRIVRALNASHFIEAVTEGFLNLTTIYDEVGETGKYPAVHSRHFGVLGQAVYAQYTGYCKIK